jgi:hypothetical protein
VADNNLVQRSVGGFADFFRWARDRLAEDTVRREVLVDLGLNPAATARVQVPDARLDSIDRYRQRVDPDKEALTAAIEDVKALYDAVRAFVEASAGGPGPIAEEAAHRLFRLLTINYVRHKVPIVFWLAQVFGFIEEAFSTELIPEAGLKGVVEVFKEIGRFFEDPEAHFKRVYGPLWPIETEEQAKTLSAATLAPLGIALAFWEKTLAKLLGLVHLGFDLPARQALYGWESVDGSLTPVADRFASGMLSVSFPGVKKIGDPAPLVDDPCKAEADPKPDAALEGAIGGTLAWIPRVHGGPGLFVSLGGSAAVELPLGGGWVSRLEIGSAGAIDFLYRGGTDVVVNGPTDGSFRFVVERAATGGTPYVVSAGDRVRLEFGRVTYAVELSSEGPAVRFRAAQAALVVAAEQDPVLDRASTTDTLRIDFDLGLGFAGDPFKFYIEGGSGFSATLPVNKSLGPVRVQTVTLGLTPSTAPSTPDLRLETSMGLGFQVGPVTLTIDRIGFDASLSFDEAAYDLGFKPPDGVGVVIDSSIVTGGGYLFHDREKHQYAGVLELAFPDLFNAKAIGLLTTRMPEPDGRSIFSLLIILSIENFPPIQLGLGFRLTGLGGLLGLDRTVNFQALQSGLKNKTLDRILFPVDPVANAPAIVSVAAAVFPPARDRLIVGPFVQIAWGAQSLVTIEIGLVLELPTPGRLLMLGKLRALFPHKDAPVVKIQIDLVGEIDFARKRLFIQAVLVESKLAGFPLVGGAALLLTWGDDPSLVLAVGGVHPAYERHLPAGFPKLDRLSVALTSGDNPRLRLDCYFALTSNSVQVGGKLELHAGIGKFTIDGVLAIDALVQFDPFAFVFDLLAKVQLKAFGVNLFAVTVKGTLSGPHPWHARGKATFEIWIFDYSVSFDRTFGSEPAPPPLPPVDVREPLLAALRDSSNWQGRLPRAGQNLVTLREADDDAEVLLHPLGTLAIRQQVVPLGVTISRFGNARPRGESRFVIDRVTVGGAEVSTTPVTEQFARAQFLDLSDDEKLASPSFDRMAAGVDLGATAIGHGPAVEASAEYDTLIYGATAAPPRPGGRYVLTADRLVALALTGMAALNAPARTGRDKYRRPDADGVRVSWPRYAVASREDLAVQSIAGTEGGMASFTAAVQALGRHVAANPADRTRLQVISTSLAP